MITLHDLPTASMQAIFDQAARHLLTQNERARIAGYGCRYRTGDGLRCAVGCFISDDEYAGITEGWGVTGILDPLEIKVSEEKLTLLRRLQAIHDEERVDNWPMELALLAEKFNLDPCILNPEPPAIS